MATPYYFAGDFVGVFLAWTGLTLVLCLTIFCCVMCPAATDSQARPRTQPLPQPQQAASRATKSYNFRPTAIS